MVDDGNGAEAARERLMAEQVAGLLEKHEPQGPDQDMSTSQTTDLLLSIFGRAGAIQRVDMAKTADGTGIVELLTRGLVRAEPLRTQYMDRVVLTITRAGHALRRRRLADDIELSDRVMTELERRERHPFGEAEPWETRISDPRVRRAVFRRKMGLVLGMQTAEREDRLQQFLDDNRAELAITDAEGVETLLGIEGGEALVSHIRRIQREETDRFLGGS